MGLIAKRNDVVEKGDRPDSASGSGRSVRRLAEQLAQLIPHHLVCLRNVASPSAGRPRSPAGRRQESFAKHRSDGISARSMSATKLHNKLAIITGASKGL